MYCDCYKKNPVWLKLCAAGGVLAMLLMIAGIPVFHPTLIPFPLPWALGILVLFVSITVPFYMMEHTCRDDNKAK